MSGIFHHPLLERLMAKLLILIFAAMFGTIMGEIMVAFPWMILLLVAFAGLLALGLVAVQRARSQWDLTQ